MTVLILFNKSQFFHGFYIVKDVAVLAVEVLCQGVDAGVTHAAQFCQQLKAFRGQVLEQRRQIVEI